VLIRITDEERQELRRRACSRGCVDAGLHNSMECCGESTRSKKSMVAQTGPMTRWTG